MTWWLAFLSRPVRAWRARRARRSARTAALVDEQLSGYAEGPDRPMHGHWYGQGDESDPGGSTRHR